MEIGYIMTDKINLLIVEDHALTLLGLKTVLNTKDFIKEISEAQTATKEISIRNHYELTNVTLDIKYPKIYENYN